MKITYYLPDTQNPFWNQVISGIQKAARQESVEVVTVSANNDEATQLKQLESYKQENLSGMLISPTGMKSLASACRNILKEGTPIVSIDQNMSDNVSASVISANLKGGTMAGKYLADKLDKDKNVVHIQAEQHLENAKLRRTSFVNTAGQLGLKIVKTIQAESRQSLASEKMEKFILEKVSFGGIFAENDAMALGAVDVLKRNHYSPWPEIVGYDGVQEALDAIKAGQMSATIAQDPTALGEKALQVMVKVIKKQSFDNLTVLLPKLATKDQL